MEVDLDPDIGCSCGLGRTWLETRPHFDRDDFPWDFPSSAIYTHLFWGTLWGSPIGPSSINHHIIISSSIIINPYQSTDFSSSHRSGTAPFEAQVVGRAVVVGIVATGGADHAHLQQQKFMVKALVNGWKRKILLNIYIYICGMYIYIYCRIGFKLLFYEIVG